VSDFEQILALQRKIQDMRDIAREDLKEFEAKLQAIATTLELLRKDANRAVPVPPTAEQILFTELRTKKTQLAALIAIAKHNGGILRTRDAKPLLQRMHLMKVTKNASNILYNVINRSERFDNVGPGVYRLRPIGVQVVVNGTTEPSVVPKSETLETVTRLGAISGKPIQ